MKGDHYQVLKKPLITEKTTQMLAEGNWVAFQVHSQANNCLLYTSDAADE